MNIIEIRLRMRAIINEAERLETLTGVYRTDEEQAIIDRLDEEWEALARNRKELARAS